MAGAGLRSSLRDGADGHAGASGAMAGGRGQRMAAHCMAVDAF
jgi:hypothetical protein